MSNLSWQSFSLKTPLHGSLHIHLPNARTLLSVISLLHACLSRITGFGALGLIMIEKLSLLAIFGSCTGSSKSLGLFTRHQSSMLFPLVGTFTSCVKLQPLARLDRDILVLLGLKSPVRTIKASGYLLRRESTLKFICSIRISLSSALADGG